LTLIFIHDTINFVLNSNELIEYWIAFYSYQERWRDVPDEARQPSNLFEKVPIHTKPACFERWEKGLIIYNAFLPVCRRAFYIFGGKTESFFQLIKT